MERAVRARLQRATAALEAATPNEAKEAAATVEAAKLLLQAAELSQDMAALEIATLKGDMDDFEFKQRDLAQEEEELVRMKAEHER